MGSQLFALDAALCQYLPNGHSWPQLSLGNGQLALHASDCLRYFEKTLHAWGWLAPVSAGHSLLTRTDSMGMIAEMCHLLAQDAVTRQIPRYLTEPKCTCTALTTLPEYLAWVPQDLLNPVSCQTPQWVPAWNRYMLNGAWQLSQLAILPEIGTASWRTPPWVLA
ncbi:hypothetical protein VTK73DRAFT_2902 [Phialemonium thermophilum]|uniref:Uncharacterized protein n=1 Tax=Phialemonium thermophilum TaxID=223376 RepID=A0ABR3VN21_9PEZI